MDLRSSRSCSDMLLDTFSIFKINKWIGMKELKKLEKEVSGQFLK